MRMERYSAKLLFQFRIVSRGRSNKLRDVEERIVTFESRSPRLALQWVKRYGKEEEFQYVNDFGNKVHFEFIGVLDLMSLGGECESCEVWYDIRTMKEPMERRDKLIPAPEHLNAFKVANKRRR